MGNYQSHSYSQKNLENFTENHTYLKQINDSRFGIAEIWSANQNPLQKTLVITHTFINETDFNKFYSELIFRTNLIHDNLLDFYGFCDLKSNNFCNQTRNLVLYFEFSGLNLKKEQKKRILNKNSFTLQEIDYLLECCIELGSFFQSKKLYHGDFRAKNILIFEENPEFFYIKLFDNGILGKYKDNYTLSLENAQEKGFLSPELLNFLNEKKIKPEYNVYKADVFSIGILVLECLTLNNGENYFDFLENIVLFEKIEQDLFLVKNQYGENIVNLIRMMLQSENERPDFKQLKGIFQDYRNLGTNFVSKNIIEKKIEPNLIVSDFTIPKTNLNFNNYTPIQSQIQTLPIIQPIFYNNFPIINRNNENIRIYQSQNLAGNQKIIQKTPISEQKINYFQENNNEFYPYLSANLNNKQNLEFKLKSLSDLDDKIEKALKLTGETLKRNSEIPLK